MPRSRGHVGAEGEGRTTGGLPAPDRPQQLWRDGQRRHGGRFMLWLRENPLAPGTEQAEDSGEQGCCKLCFWKTATYR